ncbi:unnamed protein product [Sphagnum balticum]
MLLVSCCSILALNGSKEMLDLLIGHGFDVEAATEVAVPEVQELLLDEGSCDIMEDNTGFNGDTLLKNILIACEGANPNYTNKGGYTAMDIASGLEGKGSRELVGLLLEAGFNLGKMDQLGEDYLTFANQN